MQTKFPDSWYYRSKIFFNHHIPHYANIQEVKKKYRQPRALPGHSQPVDFQAEEITLDIPMEGITCKEWTISPHFPPVVSKLATDSYKNNVYHPIAMLLAAQALNDIM